MKKTVWMIGAGASIDNTKHINKKNKHNFNSLNKKSKNIIYPSIKGFFDIAKNEKITTNDGEINYDFYELNNYLINNYGVSLKNKNIELNIEDVMTMVEIDIQKFNRPKNYMVKNQLLKIIIKVFHKLNSYYYGASKYDILVNNILQKQDTIITFNWDLLLDDLFGRQYIARGNNRKVDYEENKTFDNQYYNTYVDLMGFDNKLYFNNLSRKYRF